MAWVVDTSVLLDIRLNDPGFGVASATCLAQHLGDGLVICPVSYIELAPAFRGNHGLQQSFLQQVGVNWLEAWTWRDTGTAHKLWADHVTKKRLGQVGKRPVADVFIEAFIPGLGPAGDGTVAPTSSVTPREDLIATRDGKLAALAKGNLPPAVATQLQADVAGLNAQIASHPDSHEPNLPVAISR